MTDKTLKKCLPAGDPRNKIEFLADEMENYQAYIANILNDLQSNTSAGPAPKEKLVSAVTNGDFVGNMGADVQLAASTIDVVNKSIKNGRLSYPIGDGWSFESEGFESGQQGGRAYRKRNQDVYYNLMGRPENGAIEMHPGTKRAVMYQVISPRRNTAFSKYKGSVEVLNQNGMIVNIGVKTAQVDDNGFLRIGGNPALRFNETSYTGVAQSPPQMVNVETPEWTLAPYSGYYEVLYIEAVGSSVLHLTNAFAWASGMLDDNVELVHREPECIGFYRDDMTTGYAESLGGNEFLYRIINTSPCLFHPSQHMVLTDVKIDGQGSGNYQPTITEMTNDYIKVVYPAEDIEIINTKPNRLVYRYGLNPSGIGFYSGTAEDEWWQIARN